MTLLVGGLSAVHDAFLAAALRGRGLDAEPIPTPGAAALATGRALLPRGHCNPTYYLAGALVEHLRAAASRAGVDAATVAAGSTLLTAGSCGPCRFAGYSGEYRRALAAAGLGAANVVTLEQTAPAPTAALAAAGVHAGAALLRDLARATVLGDVLVACGCRTRPLAREPDEVEGILAGARAAVAGALAARRSALPAIRALRAALAGIERRPAAPLIRVRLTGELFAATTDGEGSHGVVRWLEARGAIVEPPPVAEWLLYLCWASRDDVRRRAGLAEPDEGPRGLAGRDPIRVLRAARQAERAVRALHRRHSSAAGIDAPLPDMDDLAALAGADYPALLRGGAGHLETATFLAADRDGTADLVVSLKPFGCLPSSAVSDAVLPGLARQARRTRFLSLETTGDMQGQFESRLELALDGAAASVTRRI